MTMIPVNSLLWRMVLQACKFFKRDMYMYIGCFSFILDILRSVTFAVVKNCVRVIVNWLG